MEKTKRATRDLQFIKSIDRWPRWPWLPVKTSSFQLGVLHADHVEDGKPRVYHATLFTLDGYFPGPEMKFTEYETIEDLLNAGWMVD